MNEWMIRWICVQLSEADQPKAPHPKEMIDMEATFAKIEDELREININGEELKRTDLELYEVQVILAHAQQFFEQVRCIIC